MNRFPPKLLLVIVLGIETVVSGWAIVGQLRRPAPPHPPVASLVDAETSRHFRELWSAADTSGQSDDWLALGQAFAVYGFFPEAERCLGQARQLAPHSVDTLFWSGLVMNRLGQTTRSTKHLSEAARRDATRRDECHYISARNHLRGDATADTQKAEAELRQVSSNHLAGQYLLAYLLVHSDRLGEAMPILDRLIADHGDIHRLYQLRARAAEQLGEFDKARDDREWAERVPETIPTDAVAERLGDRGHQFGLDNRILRAGQLASQKNLDAVVKELNTILKIAYRPRVARLLASIELRRGRSASAVKLLETLIRRDGSTADTLIELGLARQSAMADSGKILGTFQLALRHKLDPETCRLMIRLVKEDGTPEELERLEALHKHAEGLQAFRENRLEEAISLFRLATTVAHREQADSFYFLGECLRHQGQRRPAVNAYRRCLELRPQHGRAAETVNRLGEG
jgi:tetratricopeptide (TPR) repeat protein